MRQLHTLVTYPGFAIMLLPALAAWRRRSREPGHWWVAGGLLLALASSLIGALLADMGVPNKIVWDLFAVPVAACLLLGIAEFQVTPVERLATRLAAPLFAVAWVAVGFWVDRSPSFRPWLGPLFSLTLLGAAGWAWVRRATTASLEPIWRQDWFWILGGLALYAAVTAPVEPLAAFLMADQEYNMVVRAWVVRNALSALAWLLIAWGIHWHRPLTHSGSSSSPAPSS